MLILNRQLLIDDKYPVAANKSAQGVLEGMIRNLYKLSSDIQQVTLQFKTQGAHELCY